METAEQRETAAQQTQQETTAQQPRLVMRREDIGRGPTRGVNRAALALMARLKAERDRVEAAREAEPLHVWVEKCWAQRRAEREARKAELRRKAQLSRRSRELAERFARGLHG